MNLLPSFLILDPSGQDLNYQKRKNDWSAWMICLSFQWWLVSAPGWVVLPRLHTERSFHLQWNMEVQGHEEGARILVCQTYEISTILIVATMRMCISYLWLQESMADDPSYYPLKHIIVLAQARLSRGCYQPVTEWSRAAKTGLVLGDAVKLWWLAWLDDSLMALVNFP